MAKLSESALGACYQLTEQWNLIGLLVNVRLTELPDHTVPDIAVFTVQRKTLRFMQLAQACQDSDSNLPVLGWESVSEFCSIKEF
jgi:hypothetical protein